ncbi:amino acid ABC transporter substrate-binding protein [Erwinia typographi]|uniref:Amino acid ABC transporter substrate-binding protein n=1 Tax=Erwinia typographi TaxID=371042 RepID=A0A0A3Z180_9GAMM|nr:transporter substrate-binding domain-containing protein [Erwinia typographi]KGT92857.1 amino acid ABC transporter substrate-binding protein [Erwinia typographi]
MTKNTLLSAALCCLISAISMSASAESLLDSIKSRNLVRIAVPQDYAPYGFVSPDMTPQGLDIDVAKLIGKQLGVRVQLIPVTGPNRVPYLQTGKADMTISSLGKTQERAKVIDFSIAYAPFFDAVFGPKDLQASTPDELAGKTVSVTRGSMQDDELTKLAPKAIIRRFEDNNSTITAFASGQTQMAAIGTTVAAAIQKQNPKLDITLKVILSNSPCYIGIQKGQQALTAKVNDIIREAKKDGTLDKISEKWLSAPAGDLPE